MENFKYLWLALGRARGHVAVVRSVLLPLGSPEEGAS
jgi:hypothetical protein